MLGTACLWTSFYRRKINPSCLSYRSWVFSHLQLNTLLTEDQPKRNSKPEGYTHVNIPGVAEPQKDYLKKTRCFSCLWFRRKCTNWLNFSSALQTCKIKTKTKKIKTNLLTIKTTPQLFSVWALNFKDSNFLHEEEDFHQDAQSTELKLASAPLLSHVKSHNHVTEDSESLSVVSTSQTPTCHQHHASRNAIPRGGLHSTGPQIQHKDHRSQLWNWTQGSVLSNSTCGILRHGHVQKSLLWGEHRFPEWTAQNYFTDLHGDRLELLSGSQIEDM